MIQEEHLGYQGQICQVRRGIEQRIRLHKVSQDNIVGDRGSREARGHSQGQRVVFDKDK